MNRNLKYKLLYEYFDIISPLLAYESCDTICETEHKVLELLCEIKDGTSLFDDCWKMIESAKCLQTYSDVALLDSSNISRDNIAYDIKRDVIVASNIKKAKRFNEIGFVEELKLGANIGNVSSCKLLAVLNWIGYLLPQNKNTAKRIWSFLAMSGDLSSMDMLINANMSNEDANQQTRWYHIKKILESEYNSFSAIATYSNYPTYSEEEVQTANLIMFISQKRNQNENKAIDRSMIQYVLDSADDYKTKIARISSNTNYYLVMHVESKYLNKEYGF